MMKMETNAGADVSTRLRELKAEYEQAQAKLVELDRYRQELRDGLLRVAGAIQVLEEFSDGAAGFSNAAVENSLNTQSDAPMPDEEAESSKPKSSKAATVAAQGE